jgi:hypothetical protein
VERGGEDKGGAFQWQRAGVMASYHLRWGRRIGSDKAGRVLPGAGGEKGHASIEGCTTTQRLLRIGMHGRGGSKPMEQVEVCTGVFH